MCGIPLLYIWLLLCYKRGKDLKTDRILKKKFGFLYGRYEEDYWYWELVVVARKMVFIIINIFFVKEALTQVVMLVMWFVLHVAANFFTSPFKNDRLDVLENGLLLCITFLCSSGLIMKAGEWSESSRASLFFFFFSISMILIVSELFMDLRADWKRARSAKKQAKLA